LFNVIRWTSIQWFQWQSSPLDCSWNVTAHAQKPDFVFRRNGPSPFKSAGASVQSTTSSRGVRINTSNAGYTMFRGSVKSTGYPLHSPVSPSLPPPPVRHRVPSHFNCNCTIRTVKDIGLWRSRSVVRHLWLSQRSAGD